MRKFAKEKSQYEKDLQEIEKLMEDKGIYLNMECDGIHIIFKKDKEFILMDIESNCSTESLPRTFDSEKMVLREEEA